MKIENKIIVEYDKILLGFFCLTNKKKRYNPCTLKQLLPKGDRNMIYAVRKD